MIVKALNKSTITILLKGKGELKATNDRKNL